MGRKIMLFLGNGFSIDLMQHIGVSDKICLTNLFAKGMDVPWPETDKPGFLSYQYCRNLWTLGARPYLDAKTAQDIIERVITCANILPKRLGLKDKIYIKAYNELEQYLMSLFVYYSDNLNLNTKLNKGKIRSWGWTKFLNGIYRDKDVEKVYIVSLNYDIWLEQLLTQWGIKFSIDGLSTDSEKFVIFKPHGSIAFHSKTKRDKAAYNIQYSDSFDDHTIDEFSFDLNHLDCLNMVNALIPPAGDSTRMNLSWSKRIRKDIETIAAEMTEEDMVILCGLSYWYVDRGEIDDYLSALPINLKDVIMVNPYPPDVFDAVLMTLFNKYNVYHSSDNLVKLI